MKLQFLLATATLASVVQSSKLTDATIVSFPQPPPMTMSEKAAIRLKPYVSGCVAHPAVNDKGEVAAGIDPMDPKNVNFDCRAKLIGTRPQVYGRSDWVDGQWDIMYMYNFGLPVEDPFAWLNAVVFINNPGVSNPKIIACSLSKGNGYYTKYKPCPKINMANNSVMLDYPILGATRLLLTTNAGESPDLIMWDEMPAPAQKALNDTAKCHPFVPINDKNFAVALKNASSDAITLGS